MKYKAFIEWLCPCERSGIVRVGPTAGRMNDLYINSCTFKLVAGDDGIDVAEFVGLNNDDGELILNFDVFKAAVRELEAAGRWRGFIVDWKRVLKDGKERRRHKVRSSIGVPNG